MGRVPDERARARDGARGDELLEVDDAIRCRLPRSFEVCPTTRNAVDILSVILRSEPLAPGFLGPAPNAPVFQIARATERYSGSAPSGSCASRRRRPDSRLAGRGAAALGSAEPRAREGAEEAGWLRAAGNPVVGSGVDDLEGDLDEFFDAEEAQDGGAGDPMTRSDSMTRRKRAMTLLADFSAVLSKSGTSADAAAKYRHADNERRFDRDARGAQRVRCGGISERVSCCSWNRWRRSSRWSRPRCRRNCWARWPESRTATRPRFVPPPEISPEMLAKMMEQFMLQAEAAPGGGEARPRIDRGSRDAIRSQLLP